MSDKDSEVQSYIENRFRAILEQSPFSIQIMSPDGYTIQVNKAWEELWGVTLEQIKEYNMLEGRTAGRKGNHALYQARICGRSRRRFRRFFTIRKKRFPINRAVTPSRRDGSKPLFIRLRTRRERFVEVVLMHEDITAQMLAEEKLKIEASIAIGCFLKRRSTASWSLMNKANISMSTKVCAASSKPRASS